jgi:hypothetical protein
MNLATSTGGLRRGYDVVAHGLESSIRRLESRYTPLDRFQPGPFEGWGFLWQPALLGFLALSAILAGNLFSNSPFKLEQNTHSWFFGLPTRVVLPGTPVNESTLMLSIVLTFGGLVLLMRVWLRLAEVVKLHKGSPLRTMWGILGLWSVPMLIAPPLFSRDVFSYAAQGEMVSRHISPYIFGPRTLGSGTFVDNVDPLWWNARAPYGPAFLWLDGTIVKLTGHNALASYVALRLLEMLAVVLLGWGLTKLARAVGRDPGETFVLGALNPLVLLTLIGGAHNDALMAALLVTGIAFAAQKRPVIGMTLVAGATAIKAPAALGMIYIAWTWPGVGPKVRDKLRPMLLAGLIGALVLGVFTFLAGFGLGWVQNLATPGTVRSWAAPATGVGMGLAELMRTFGSTVSLESMISVTRVIGMVAACALCVWLLLNAERRGWIRTLAVSLLLLVILGPVVQPWYLVWGIMLLAAVYEGREHFWLLALSITSPFIGLPGGRQLVSGIIHANSTAIIATLLILGGMLLVPLGTWTQWSWPGARELEPVAA